MRCSAFEVQLPPPSEEWRTLEAQVLRQALKPSTWTESAFVAAHNVIQDVHSCVLRTDCCQLTQAMPFGSYANGLSLHSSDIDIVILNLIEPEDPNTGGAPHHSSPHKHALS